MPRRPSLDAPGALHQVKGDVVQLVQKMLYGKRKREERYSMPRKARLDIPGTLHHVMARGIEGTNIFRNEEDRRSFVDRIRLLVKETGTRIMAWTLVDNHVHLLTHQLHKKCYLGLDNN